MKQGVVQQPGVHCLAAGLPWLWQDVQDEEQFIFLIRLPQNTSMVPAAPEAMLVSVVSATARGRTGVLRQAVLMPLFHVDFHGLFCHQRPCWHQWSELLLEAVLAPVVCTTSWGHGDVYSLCYLWRPLISLVCAAAEGHVGVHGPCHHRILCGSPWRVLSLTVKSKEVSFAAISRTADS